MNPKISIIIPVYNSEKSIEKCIKSVINQTYKNIEIIIVNDGSKDNSLNICKSIKDERIIIINSYNKGVSSARNIGLDNASGEYISFIDSDDYLENNMYEICISKIQETKVDILKFSYYRERSNKRKTIYQYKIKTNEIIYKESYVNEIYNEIFASRAFEGVWNSIFKAEVIKSIRFNENLIVAEDFLFMINCIFKSNSIIFINNPLYHYVLNAQSVTQKYNANKLLKRCQDIIISYSTAFELINKEIESNISYKNKVIKLIEDKISIFATNENYNNFKIYMTKLKEDKIISNFYNDLDIKLYNGNFIFYIKKRIVGKAKQFLKKVIYK